MEFIVDIRMLFPSHHGTILDDRRILYYLLSWILFSRLYVIRSSLYVLRYTLYNYLHETKGCSARDCGFE